MEIGKILRELRQEKNFSQLDIGKRTGLHQCYVSRVEKGRTIPNVETLEKFASVLGIPLYRLFTDDEAVRMPKLLSTKTETESRIDDTDGFAKAFKRIDDRSRKLLLGLAQKMTRRHPLRRIKSRVVNKNGSEISSG